MTRVKLGLTLTAPADCGMRVNGMRSSGLRYPPPWTGRGGRDSGPRRGGGDDDTDDHPGRETPSIWCRCTTACRFVDSQERAARDLQRWAGLRRWWLRWAAAVASPACRVRLSCVAVETQCRLVRERPVRAREGASASGESWFPPRPGCSRASRGVAFHIL